MTEDKVHKYIVFLIIKQWFKSDIQARLQSEATALLLTSLSALTAAKQYLGDPIHCIFDTR